MKQVIIVIGGGHAGDEFEVGGFGEELTQSNLDERVLIHQEDA